MLADAWLAPRTTLYRGPVPDGLDDDGVVNMKDLAEMARYWEGECEF